MKTLFLKLINNCTILPNVSGMFCFRRLLDKETMLDRSDLNRPRSLSDSSSSDSLPLSSLAGASSVASSASSSKYYAKKKTKHETATEIFFATKQKHPHIVSVAIFSGIWYWFLYKNWKRGKELSSPIT